MKKVWYGLVVITIICLVILGPPIVLWAMLYKLFMMISSYTGIDSLSVRQILGLIVMLFIGAAGFQLAYYYIIAASQRIGTIWKEQALQARLKKAMDEAAKAFVQK